MKRFITLLALMLAALVSPVSAQEFPPAPDGPIYDAADLLPATEEQQLSDRLIAYNRETGRSIVIATEASTNGQDIDLYSRKLAEFWGIGGAETEQGVLLYIARDDRKMAIKTARGVQGTLTDISSGRIIRNTLRPAFRAGDYAGGISQAVDQIIERLDMDPVEAAAVAEAEAAAERDRNNEGGFPIGFLIWIAIIFVFFILPMMRGRGRRRRFGTGSMVGDIILWEVGSAIARGAMSGGDDWGGGGGFGGGGGGFGGFGGGGGGFNGGGASGGW